MYRSFFSSLLVLMVFTSLFYAQEEDVPEITAKELIEKMKADTNLVIVDVRMADELTGPLGKIEGVIHIPITEIKFRMNELENHKDDLIAVIGRSGKRSKFGAMFLREGGYNAVNVSDGMLGYRQEKDLK